MTKKAQVVLKEQAQVINAVAQHRQPLDAEAEREADRKKRWCLIGYGDVVGWVAAWYLEEGGETSAFNGGDWF